MLAEIRHDDTNDIVEWHLGGTLSVEAIAKAYDGLLNHPAWASARHLMVVLGRTSRLGEVSLGDIESFQKHLIARQFVFESDVKRRVALVPLLSEHEGLTEFHRLSFEDQALLETEVFDDEGLARDWLLDAA